MSMSNESKEYREFVATWATRLSARYGHDIGVKIMNKLFIRMGEGRKLPTTVRYCHDYDNGCMHVVVSRIKPARLDFDSEPRKLTFE